jgi:uncharacterized membrane protein
MHFIRADIYEPINRFAFPECSRRRLYIHGGIEIALGLGLSARTTRQISTLGLTCYLLYAGINAIRNR